MVSHLPFSDQILGMHVGRRVKSLRRELGYTRRELAERSSISERYIGQLENGQANVSLNVLNRIVAELGTSIACVLPRSKERIRHEPLNRLLTSLQDDELEQVFRLVSSKFETHVHPGKGVALLGMRGAGKTSLGSSLSDLSGIPFVRLTQEIAQHNNMTVGELIELRGINGFRRLERETLEKLGLGVDGDEVGHSLLSVEFRAGAESDGILPGPADGGSGKVFGALGGNKILQF